MYQYETLKLEKGMHHLTNKSFLQALEEADPSAQYANTPLAKLDAYERQLKRFNIHVSGENCDMVEKFFTTTETAVLFPEFVRRAVLQGMEDTILPEIVAVISRNATSSFYGCDLVDTTAYSTITPGTAMPVSTIQESASTITLQKYGRNIQASYEAVRQQRLDIFALMIRKIGMRIAQSIVTKAVTVMKNVSNSTKITVATANFAYNSLATLYGTFTVFKMKVLLASPANTAKILTMSQMADCCSQKVNEIYLPFGTKLITCPQLDDNTILGLDSDFALEQMQSSEVILETDKLIDCQMESIGVSVTLGFRVPMSDSVKQLALT